jgi:hypothetical protein
MNSSFKHHISSIVTENYTLMFYKVKIFTNYEKIVPKFVGLSISLARVGTMLPLVREITRIKKV